MNPHRLSLFALSNIPGMLANCYCCTITLCSILKDYLCKSQSMLNAVLLPFFKLLLLHYQIFILDSSLVGIAEEEVAESNKVGEHHDE